MVMGAPKRGGDAHEPHDADDGVEDLASLNDEAPDGAGHVPVLPTQVLEVLAPAPGQVILDCTLGRGGHAALLIPRLAPGGRYIGLDVDPANIEFARARLAGAPVRVDLVQANFAVARRVLDDLGVARVDILLADLGFASSQMSDPARGMSFQREGPLDMRLDPSIPATAADLVSRLSERELANLIHQFGEEHLSRKIARKIVEERSRSPIHTTRALAELVRRAYGASARQSRIDPATRTFMALRIAVNDELGVLDRLLDELPKLLASGGRAAVISFHSLEDRRVKQAFGRYEREERGLRLTRKPLVASDEECRDNPRSRSAKLRGLLLK